MSSLIQETPGGNHVVRSVRADAVRLGIREMRRSFAVSASILIEDWEVEDIALLNAAQMDRLLDAGPDVIVLGTGEARQGLEPALLYRALAKGVGVEVMDNAAAARTYNVLLAEERNVLAAFILPERR